MKTDFNDFGNPQVAKLPAHLRQFVVSQDYDNYTPVDHAVWRYVMRKNLAYLSKVADSSYLKGLEKTGITIDSIPNIKDMNTILGKIGWGCVCVDGFLPPSSFMEFQAYKVLVIAADIRQIEHIEYTPAPDILHEAAGHAPIIADPTYAEYLRLFGEIGSKAISSAQDFELYEAIRHLSIIKEDPNTEEKEIVQAEKDIEGIQANMEQPSEMAQIRNLHWWTVEYGLIGDLNQPKIYGAGLLSSIGESESCLREEVKKLPYSIEAAQQAFDITEPQPQLYVTPSYTHLTQVLEEFANTMALRIGGLEGLEKAIASNNTCTVEYSSGLQVSGIFNNVISDNGQIVYLSTSSPTALAWQNKELVGHDKSYHAHGFSSPVGRLKNTSMPLENMSIDELMNIEIEAGKQVSLEFESGVNVQGKLINVSKNRKGLNMILSFEDCHVSYNDEVLFQPEWGTYDMAVGESIVSVFSGAADMAVFSKDNPFVPSELTHKIQYGEKRLELHKLYQKIRDVREGNADKQELASVWQELINHPKDWLAAVEILEISTDKSLNAEIRTHLNNADGDEVTKALIKDSLSLIE
ncbi:MAG: aromatic amino acid hydroxylase [Flavobacteriales bacterium]|nr:aromatic amino acid hydroxylase [Flavobacteriales bacterium]